MTRSSCSTSFPELTRSDPVLPGVLRAFLDRVPARAKILLAGSAVRSMQALQEERAPLYGRVDRTLHLHPFDPHEAALLLTDLAPAERARVWTLVGGIPLYLRWWDQGGSIADNLGRLVGEPDGRLLLEGQLVLATETETGDLAERVLRAIAARRTKHSEISDAVRADAGRTPGPAGRAAPDRAAGPRHRRPRRTRRRVYRIADNSLAFWLGVVDRHRTAIDRGLGATVAARDPRRARRPRRPVLGGGLPRAPAAHGRRRPPARSLGGTGSLGGATPPSRSRSTRSADGPCAHARARGRGEVGREGRRRTDGAAPPPSCRGDREPAPTSPWPSPRGVR